MEPPVLLSADHDFSSETEFPNGPIGPLHRIMSCSVIGPTRHGQVRPGIRTDGRVGTTVTGNGDPVIVPDHRHLRNRQCRVELFPSLRRSLLSGNVTIPIPCRTRSSFETFSRHPWSTKSGLAGKDIADLRVTELTRKGLDDFSLLCLSIVFLKSIRKQPLFSNCFVISGRIVSTWMQPVNMHGPAPPDKHKESARFMQPLLGDVF